MKFRLFCLALAATTLVLPARPGSAQEQFPFQIFERYLEPLIQQIGMPGLSAAILLQGKVVWRYNYGFADVERKIPTAFDTPYPVGGITQAVSGVLLGVCIDRFGFNIDDNIRLSYPAFPIADTSTRQVVSHSTGGRYRYDPALFTLLTPVVESPGCLRQPYRKALAVEVLDRLAMTRSVPGLDLNRPEGAGARALFDEADLKKYLSLLSDVAVPYRIDAKGNSTRSDYPSYSLDAATGLVSTVEDLAKFEGQLDKRDGHPVSVSTLNKMWSNQVFTIQDTNLQIAMPTGLGWFVTNESGQRLVWTFGHIPDAGSALIVKMTKPATASVAEQRLTLIMLANSSGLAKGYDLENAQVTSSPFVKVFLRLFI
jgi:CubicO group peptidase (beta-lactamase class C family)